MILALQAILRNNDDFLFFETAYLWKYGKRIDVSGDITAWRTKLIIPKYVCEFINHVNGSTPSFRPMSPYFKRQHG